MDRILNLSFESRLTKLKEINSSFDAGVLQIAYHGRNRNGSDISKDAFERAIKTMYNCPLVCNYDRDSDTLGGHDMAVVTDSEGEMRIINLTTPVGCIPESAKVWWETVAEEDGTENEYLFADAILWKRQEAYQKIKKDGVSAQSMEIKVLDGKVVDGVYEIYDFEFTAFALIGVEPCFESASLSLFSKEEFKAQFAAMLDDIRANYQSIAAFNKVDDNNSTKGGNKTLEEKKKIIAEFGVEESDLGFNLEDVTEDELREKLEEMKAQGGDDSPEGADGEFSAEPEAKDFELNQNLFEEIEHALCAVRIATEWGDRCKYHLVDFDVEAGEVYAWDTEDWLLYGFSYSMDGDAVVIDFESKKRKKYAIVDFEGSEQPSPFVEVFTEMESALVEAAKVAHRCDEVAAALEAANTELEELRSFKANAESERRTSEINSVLSNFADLKGIAAYDEWVENGTDMSPEELEEKCYALKGRFARFSKPVADRAPKIQVTGTSDGESDEPYNGVFLKYGIANVE